MDRDLHSGYAYNRLDEITADFESWVQVRCKDEFDFEKKVIVDRLVQRFVEHTFYPYLEHCAGRREAGLAALPDEDPLLSYDGLEINQHSGSVKISGKLYLLSLGHFFLHWFHVLLHLFPRPIWPTKNKIKSATLLFGVGVEALFDNDKSDNTQFARYCKEGPISPLNQSTNLVIQAAFQGVSDLASPFYYHRFPIHKLLTSCSLGVAGRTILCLRHCAMFFKFFVALTKNPLLVLLARDIAYLPMVRCLDSGDKIEAVIITNSVHTSQPLWMRESLHRGFKVHMIWYAQNVIPFVFRADRVESKFPSYENLCVDDHWVWTEGFADYLQKIGVAGKKHVVGAILWYLPGAAGTELTSGKEVIKLTVFDVTPVRNEVAYKCGHLYNYYSADVLIKFINDIVTMAAELSKIRGKEVRILLKCKRGYNQGHDQRYIELIDSLSDEGLIEIVSHKTNLYQFLRNSDVSIVIPNSSPALLAAELKRNAVYYDPTGSLANNHETSEFITHANSVDQLLQATLNAID